MLKRIALLAAVSLSVSAGATTVAWTDWTSFGSSSAVGTIAASGGPVNVQYSGPYAFGQTGCGTSWWDPGTYNGALNKPFSCDIVALNAGGQKTITFDVAVTDPYLALMSWNGNTVFFNAVFDVVSNGTGYWGVGTPIVNATSDGFFGSGEVHAILQFKGTYTSLTFTDTSENWHGFTVGVADVATSGVPEPATATMAVAGLALLALGRRRRVAPRLPTA